MLYNKKMNFLFVLRRVCSYAFPAVVVGFFFIGIMETFFRGSVSFYVSLWWMLLPLLLTSVCFGFENSRSLPYFTYFFSKRKRIIIFCILEILFLFGFFFAIPNIPQDFFWKIFFVSFFLFTIFQIVSFFSVDDFSKKLFLYKKKKKNLFLWLAMIIAFSVFVFSWIQIVLKIQI